MCCCVQRYRRKRNKVNFLYRSRRFSTGFSCMSSCNAVLRRLVRCVFCLDLLQAITLTFDRKLPSQVRSPLCNEARRYAPPPPTTVRRRLKSRRICVRPRTGPQSAHLRWPAVAKLQVGQRAYSLGSCAMGTGRRTDRVVPKLPIERGA